MSSLNVDSLLMFSSFAESDSIGILDNTLNAFIFSLKNSEGLPPFKCFAKNEHGAIYKNECCGPSFGKGPYLRFRISESVCIKVQCMCDSKLKIPSFITLHLDSIACYL